MRGFADAPSRKTLPPGVRPERYVLKLRPDLHDFTFEGRAEIGILVEKPTKEVVLNALELEIGDARVRLSNGRDLQATGIEVDGGEETALLAFAEELPLGPATLAVEYTGVLNDQMRGFYRSEYTTPEGERRFLGATQFEATAARRAFPCWDEPAHKATFQVTLVIPSEMAAISNTLPEAEEVLGDGTKAVRFAETPRMSTYLLAFVVGQLEAVEAKGPDGVLHRVWATPDKAEFGRFALETSQRILAYLNDYFGTPYPLEKLDHLALPDFASGAMENWGAITYRERILLFDPATSAALTKQYIADVMAHEVAHMWFGDLVTMAWWDDLWLNESFATWMGTKTVDVLFPEWAFWTQFLFQDTTAGLALDGLRNSHPIQVEVRDPAEIRQIFDAISYNKGASILWMLEGFLGEETFRRGIRSYMKAHAYENATTADLWRALGEASGEGVPDLMDTWVKQTGFPLLKATVDRQAGGPHLHLAQRRFLYEHLHGKEEDDDTRWLVPVVTQTAGGKVTSRFLLDALEAGRALGTKAAEWVKVNAGQTGFYRVHYDEEEWERLRQAVAAGALPATDRLGLQSDAYALARAGYAPATLFLEVTEAYEGETDATVWREISSNLRAFERVIADEPYLSSFHAYGRRLYEPAAARAGWDAGEEEGHLDILLRSTVLGQLGSYDHAATIEEARARFWAYADGEASLDPNLRGVVYGLVGQEADRAAYDRLWELEEKATLNEEKVRLLAALGRPKREELLRETLEASLTKRVRSQDTVMVVTSVAGNMHGRDLAWDFVREQWEEFDRRYGKGGFMIQRLMGTADAFATVRRAEEVEAFFAEHPVPAAQRKLQQTLEKIRLNAAWLERNGGDLRAWFGKRS